MSIGSPYLYQESIPEETHNPPTDPEREADFDKAYQKLVQKFYKEHGNNMLIPDEDLNKVDSQKVNIEELQRRIEEGARKKEERMMMMKQEREMKEIEGCTF